MALSAGPVFLILDGSSIALNKVISQCILKKKKMFIVEIACCANFEVYYFEEFRDLFSISCLYLLKRPIIYLLLQLWSHLLNWILNLPYIWMHTRTKSKGWVAEGNNHSLTINLQSLTLVTGPIALMELIINRNIGPWACYSLALDRAQLFKRVWITLSAGV